MARKFSNSFYEGLSPASPRWCRMAATLRRQNFSVAGSPIMCYLATFPVPFLWTASLSGEAIFFACRTPATRS